MAGEPQNENIASRFICKSNKRINYYTFPITVTHGTALAVGIVILLVIEIPIADVLKGLLAKGSVDSSLSVIVAVVVDDAVVPMDKLLYESFSSLDIIRLLLFLLQGCSWYCIECGDTCATL